MGIAHFQQALDVAEVRLETVDATPQLRRLLAPRLRHLPHQQDLTLDQGQIGAQRSLWRHRGGGGGHQGGGG